MRKTALVLPVLMLAAAADGPRGNDVSEAFKKVRDSVVVIETTQKTVLEDQPEGLVSMGGIGSGVLISQDGRIMTAAHVVQAADRIRVLFGSGEAVNARVVASVPSADLALIQLESMPEVFQVAPLGDSDAAEVGDEVFVVGAPLASATP